MQKNDSYVPPMPEILAQLSELHGKLPYKLTNDYLFRAVFQTNKKVLKELLAAVLHLDSAEIRELDILNPILLGEAMNEKTCILDLFLLMNDHTRINIEMQVASTDYYMGSFSMPAVPMTIWSGEKTIRS